MVSRSTTVSIMIAAFLFIVGIPAYFAHQYDWHLLISSQVGRLAMQGIVEGLYHVLPRSIDMGHLAGVLILQEGAVAWGAVLNTAVVGAGALGVATVYFRRCDY